MCTRSRNRGKSEFVGLAQGETRLHAAAGHPHRHRVDMVIAADSLANFAHRSAPELAPPDHQRVLEQAARFQVLDQSRTGLIDVAADMVQVARQGLAGDAVVVPVGVIKLNEADAALDQTTGKQAVVRKRRLAREPPRRA